MNYSQRKSLISLILLLFGVYIQDKFLFISLFFIGTGLFLVITDLDKKLKEEKDDKGNYKKVRKV